MNHLDIEQPLFPETKPHVWIQWKGTDVCCDVHCSCGNHSHYDGDFFYTFQCNKCGKYWEVGTHMPIYEVTKEAAGAYVKQLSCDDGN